MSQLTPDLSELLDIEMKEYKFNPKPFKLNVKWSSMPSQAFMDSSIIEKKFRKKERKISTNISDWTEYYEENFEVRTYEIRME